MKKKTHLFFLLFSLLLLIFFFETCILIFFYQFSFSSLRKTLFASLLLTFSLSPFVYFFFYRPLVCQWEKEQALRERYERLSQELSKSRETQKKVKKLAEEMSSYLHIVENPSWGILILDPEGRVLYINSASEKILSRSRKELEGKVLGIPTSKGKILEMELIGKDLDFRVGMVWSEPIVWKGKKATLVLLRDITKEKLLEKQIEIEDRLIFWEKLIQSIASELQNVFQRILNYAEIIQSQEEKAKKDLAVICNQCQQGAKLLESILDISLKHPSKISFDLAHLIRTILKAISARVAPFVEVSFSKEKGKYPVVVDPLLIQRTLTHLLLSPKRKKGAIHLVLQRVKKKCFFLTEEEKKWCELLIRHPATWVKGKVSHLFEFIEQDKLKEGTEIVLTQAYQVMKQHKGYLFLESEEGRGTKISLYFPLESLVEDTVVVQ